MGHDVWRLHELWALLAFVTPAAGAEPATGLRLQVPDADWALVVAAPGFEFSEPESNSDGTRFWTFGDCEDPGVVLTVVIEKDEWSETPDECADDARISQNAEDLSRNSRKGMTVTEYAVLEFKGDRISQRHAHAHLARGGYCIEAHLSISDYQKQRRSVIDELLDSIRLVDLEDPPPPG